MKTTNEAVATVMGRLYAHFSGHESSTGTRLLLIVVLAVLVHLTVKAIRGSAIGSSTEARRGRVRSTLSRTSRNSSRSSSLSPVA